MTDIPDMASEASRRWVGVGTSNESSARRAGSSAAAQALIGSGPRLVIVFASDEFDLQELLGGVRDELDGVPLIGCSTAGEIAASGPGDAGVVVTILGGEGFAISTSVARGASEDLRAAGSGAASCLSALEPREHRLLMLLTDGLAGDQQEIVRGAHQVAGGGVPLVGGCAGDGMKMRSTYQLYDGEVLSNAVVAAAIGSDAPIGIGVRHGWRRVGAPMLVTRSSENRVYELDGQPALDVYLERLDVPSPASSEPDHFTQFALSHPLGLSRRSAEEHVRFISGANFEDRSLGCIAAVPQGGLVWLMEGDEDSVLRATDEACADALAGFASDPLGLIAFDCIARRGVLGDKGIAAEIARVASNGRGAPVAGFYTYGEIARTRGMSGFHNQTLVVLALA